MRGTAFKRCTRPVRRDDRGRKVTGSKAHGSWSYKVDVPGESGHRRQIVKGGFGTKSQAEEAMADVVGMAGRGVDQLPDLRADRPSRTRGRQCWWQRLASVRPPPL